MELRTALATFVSFDTQWKTAATPSIQLQRKETLGMLDEQEKHQVKELCERIAKEQDHNQFSMLIAQLNQLLEKSELRSNSARNNLSHSPKKSSRPNI
jgi:predicted RNase H-like nuclease